jgi:hypothetical protein
MRGRDPEVNKLVRLFGSLARQKRDKYLKAKGRKESPRSLHQWINSGHLPTELLKILRSAEQITSTRRGKEFNQIVHCLLLETLPTLGRPSKKIGIIEGAMKLQTVTKRSGRPQTATPAEQVSWAKYVLGVKWALLSKELSIQNYSELYAHLMKYPEDELEVSDADAVRVVEARSPSQHGVTLNQLQLRARVKKFQRIKERFPDDVAPPKVGGN